VVTEIRYDTGFFRTRIFVSRELPRWKFRRFSAAVATSREGYQAQPLTPQRSISGLGSVCA
jgi:hypothetical protein